MHRLGRIGVEMRHIPLVAVYLFTDRCEVAQVFELVDAADWAQAPNSTRIFDLPRISLTRTRPRAGDGALDEGDVVRRGGAGEHFTEFNDVHDSGKPDDILFQIGDLELASFTTGKIEKAAFGFMVIGPPLGPAIDS